MGDDIKSNSSKTKLNTTKNKGNQRNTSTLNELPIRTQNILIVRGVNNKKRVLRFRANLNGKQYGNSLANLFEHLNINNRSLSKNKKNNVDDHSSLKDKNKNIDAQSSKQDRREKINKKESNRKHAMNRKRRNRSVPRKKRISSLTFL